MNKPILLLSFALIFIGCRQKTPNSKKNVENEKAEQSSFMWLSVSVKDSVKFIGFSTRVFNQGRDSVVYAHYETDLYKSIEDAKNPLFKKQSILVLNALSENANLPDTMYVQAKGISKGTLIKKNSDFNIFSGFDGTEWHIKDGEIWKTIKDFKN